MNMLLPRFVKNTYRKEPISSFILIVGAVDAVLGGVDERWTLFSVGIGLLMLAMGLRWWQSQNGKPIPRNEAPRRYLPPSSIDQNPLPPLTPKRHRSGSS